VPEVQSEGEALLSERSECEGGLWLPGLGDQSGAPTRSWKKSKMPQKNGEEGSYSIFQASVIKRENKDKTH